MLFGIEPNWIRKVGSEGADNASASAEIETREKRLIEIERANVFNPDLAKYNNSGESEDEDPQDGGGSNQRAASRCCGLFKKTKSAGGGQPSPSARRGFQDRIIISVISPWY